MKVYFLRVGYCSCCFEIGREWKGRRGNAGRKSEGKRALFFGVTAADPFSFSGVKIKVSNYFSLSLQFIKSCWNW